MNTLRHLLCSTAASLGALGCVPAGAAGEAPGTSACSARSGAQATMLVELYTSEGCSSCPPADRWLATLRGRPGVLAAAFHVDYWDTLGWPDRFAQARFSARQQAGQRAAGARFSYTPQVLVDGRDWRGWPVLPADAGVPARVQLALRRTGPASVQAELVPLDGAPPRLGLWWALLEDGHASAVRAGENRGVTLQHDHVVRAWHDEGPVGTRRQWSLPASAAGEGGRRARLLLVATDADTGRPVQALALDC